MHLVLAVLLVCYLCPARSLRTDQDFWKDLAKNELEETLKIKWNTTKAKNVILFVGDGMDLNTITATRIYKGGETHRLVFEKFPHMGLLKTYSADKMVPDSACTATALFNGVKTNKDTVGVDASVKKKDCARSLESEARLSSLAAGALGMGRSAGFVTTMRVTHATPSPLYAHSADRIWECDALMPPGNENCKDIGRQLIEDEPGRNLNVILGGGRHTLVSSGNDSIRPWYCKRKDGRNLIEDYEKDKQARGLKYSVVSSINELKALNYGETDYLMGIFADSHLSYEYEKNKTLAEPTLSEMVEAAIKVLQNNDKGFFLMVEGGNIDMAHHRGRAKAAIMEAVAFEDAVRVAMALTDEEDTLLIVTSDHAHTLNINGHPDRGSNIFGLADVSQYDGTNYTTLSYSNGGPDSNHFYVARDKDNNTVVRRRDPSREDTESMDYHQVAGITLVENLHGGGDVAIYARGPHAHLFHNVHEQHYVYHAIMYASTHSSAYSLHTPLILMAVMVSISILNKLL